MAIPTSTLFFSRSRVLPKAIFEFLYGQIDKPLTSIGGMDFPVVVDDKPAPALLQHRDGLSGLNIEIASKWDLLSLMHGDLQRMDRKINVIVN